MPCVLAKYIKASLSAEHERIDPRENTPPLMSLAATPTAGYTPLSNARRIGKSARLSPKERQLKREAAQEQVFYPSREPLSEHLGKKVLEMDLYPTDGVQNYTRRIPFRGAKEELLKSTGRSYFDVFEYRFTAPDIFGVNQYYWVMWDYFTGLVRVHDLFDCCKPGKTEPGHAVREKVNPGLQKISLNITGGNLHAQGYWLPFEVAKALVAKFCYRIRFALTIIFGEDFPEMCLPEHHPDFGKYNIPQSIIVKSERDLEAQRLLYEKRQQEHLRTLQGSPLNAVSCLRTLELGLEPQFSSNVRVARSAMTDDACHADAGRFYDPVRGSFTNGCSNPGGTSSPYDRSKNSTPSSDCVMYDLGENVSQAALQAPSASKTGAQRQLETWPRQPLCYGQIAQPSIDRLRLPPPTIAINQQVPCANSPTITKTSNNQREILGDISRYAVSHNPVTSLQQPEVELEDVHDSKRRKRSPETICCIDECGIQPKFQTAGLFDNSTSVSRDHSVPAPLKPFTRPLLIADIERQQDEESENIQMIEAAGSLISLRIKDYELSFKRGVIRQHASASS